MSDPGTAVGEILGRCLDAGHGVGDCLAASKQVLKDAHLDQSRKLLGLGVCPAGTYYKIVSRVSRVILLTLLHLKMFKNIPKSSPNGAKLFKTVQNDAKRLQK